MVNTKNRSKWVRVQRWQWWPGMCHQEAWGTRPDGWAWSLPFSPQLAVAQGKSVYLLYLFTWNLEIKCSYLMAFEGAVEGWKPRSTWHSSGDTKTPARRSGVVWVLLLSGRQLLLLPDLKYLHPDPFQSLSLSFPGRPQTFCRMKHRL